MNTDTLPTPTHPLLPNAHVGVIPTGKVKFGFFKFVFLLWKLLIKRDEAVQVNKDLDAHRYLIDLFYWERMENLLKTTPIVVEFDPLPLIWKSIRNPILSSWDSDWNVMTA